MAPHRATLSVGKRGQRSVAGGGAGRAAAAARLSTLTPRPSSSRAGASTAGMLTVNRSSMDSARRHSRASGIGAARSRCPDPRPVSDKAFWQSATHQLVAFLNEQRLGGRCYSEGRPPVTYKDLLKCGGREFDEIFTFMYTFYSPDFSLEGKKREEEVPAAMKLLNYPGLITKSHLITIGCLHSWPSVIAMLVWLADQVLLVYGSDLLTPLLPTVDNDGFPEVDPEEYILLRHSLETYGAWLAGADQTDDDGQRLAAALVDLLPMDDTEMRRLQAENKRLRDELPRVDDLQQKVDEQAEQLGALESDERRMTDYVDALRQQNGERRRELERLEQQREHRANLLQMLREQLEALKAEVGQQEMSSEDVAQIAQQRAGIQKQIDCCRAESDQVIARTDVLEMELNRAQALLETTGRQLNGELSVLAGALPAASGLEVRLRGTPAAQLQQLSGTERALQEAERAARNDEERLMMAVLQQEKAAREMRGALDKERQEVFRLEARLRRLQEEDAADQSKVDSMHVKLDSDLTEVETQITKITQEIQQVNVTSLQGQLDAQTRRLMEQNTVFEKELAQRSQEITEKAALALEFRQRVETEMGYVVIKVKEIMQDTSAKVKEKVIGYGDNKEDKPPIEDSGSGDRE